MSPTGPWPPRLTSPGSLTCDAAYRLLYAVNAGGDAVSVCVLNALDGGSIQSYRVDAGYLRPQRAWCRELGLDPKAMP